MSIYRYQRRQWLVIEGPNGIKASEDITPENKEKLLEFATYLKASGKSPPRQVKLLMTLKKLGTLLGPISFKEAKRRDMERVLAKIEGSDYTKSDFKKITKQFYAWLFDVEDPRHEGYPKVVSWIRPKEPKSTLKASDLLTPGEVKRLISATTDLRMKALIAVCYECGLRIGEALNLKIGDIHLKENYASLSVVSKKTKISRQIFSIGVILK